jgi:hypothetical protein
MVLITYISEIGGSFRIIFIIIVIIIIIIKKKKVLCLKVDTSIC